MERLLFVNRDVQYTPYSMSTWVVYNHSLWLMWDGALSGFFALALLHFPHSYSYCVWGEVLAFRQPSSSILT